MEMLERMSFSAGLPAETTGLCRWFGSGAAGTSTFDGGPHASQIEYAPKFSTFQRGHGRNAFGRGKPFGGHHLHRRSDYRGWQRHRRRRYPPADFLSWNLELNGVGASFNLLRETASSSNKAPTRSHLRSLSTSAG